MEAALEELVAVDGTKTLAIKRSLLAEVKRRRRSQALVDLIESWEAEDEAIDQAHLDWADAVLDRQGVWRQPSRQANLARALRYFPLDESISVGRRLASSNTSDVVDAHLAVVAESLGTFILTSDPDDMSQLEARHERY
ncbi:hypothetical protein GQR58_029670 [Nymphon striatum]|nr:hypothetical protein GQR58_029670 [Nymphon striatum]